MRIKNIFSTLLIVVMMFTLAGCNTADETGNNANGSGKNNSDTINIKLAGQSPEDHPSTQALYDFAEKVNEKTDGRVKIKVYPANQLGDYTTVFEEVGRGTIEMALIGLPGNQDKRLELIFTPYMVSSYEGIEERYGPDSYVFNKIQEITDELGVKLLAFHANGFGGVGTSKEINNLLDLGSDKDILLRTAPLDVFQQPMKDIGFRTVTIPFADLYTALQTGSADGWAGGEPSLNYFGFRDVINYFYQTNDFFNADSFLINSEVYESFSEEDRLVINEAATELMNNSFETAKNYDEKYRNLLEEKGIEVIEFSEEELDQIAEFVRENTWPKLEDSLGDGIIDSLTKELK
ncbi:TRAP transporter substrate-binding protein DctP [Salirhabdus salicampi]|uniref:TRAP transporter substrate-binding protein DctP n=1 Tax=Salirhabdus salicampi TaxID=476102 RepID=UPI0020C3A4DD|nr:TRAP transporter substrate-binding protein DctP [Salirhabdus salicampi]MCP8616339.1 TRAP transporter substrate-binding protein DctP [Salirhabdus salicampi]